MGSRQLEPARPVEDRVLLRDDPVVALVGLLGAPERLGARPAVADRDGALDLLGHERVVGHDDDRRPERLVDAAQQRRTRPPTSRCRARRSARRRGRRTGRWRARPRSRPAAARRPKAVGPVGRAVAEADELQQLEARGSAAASVRRGPSAARRCRPRSGTAAGCARSAATRTRRSRRRKRVRSRVREPAEVVAGDDRPARPTARPSHRGCPSSVDLPLPDAPTIATISPGSTSRSRPWSATTSRSASLIDPDEPVAGDDGPLAVADPGRSAGRSSGSGRRSRARSGAVGRRGSISGAGSIGTTGRTSFKSSSKRGGWRHPALEHDAEQEPDADDDGDRDQDQEQRERLEHERDARPGSRRARRGRAPSRSSPNRPDRRGAAEEERDERRRAVLGGRERGRVWRW